MDNLATVIFFVLLITVPTLLLLTLSSVWSLKSEVAFIKSKLLDVENLLLRTELSKEFEIEEKRTKFRAGTNLDASLFKEQEVLSAKICNLSKTGALISCSGALGLNQTYPFEFSISPEKKIQTKIRVVRVLDEPSHFGVCFQNLSVDSLQNLSAFLSDLARNSLLLEKE